MELDFRGGNLGEEKMTCGVWASALYLRLVEYRRMF